VTLGIRSRLFLTSLGVLIVVGGVSSFYLQSELRQLLESRTESQIMRLASSARSTIEESTNTSTASDFEMLAKKLGVATGSRITVILHDGLVVGDSALSKSALRKLDNHAQRPEIQSAKRSEYGISRRFSTTLRTEMLYVAVTFNTSAGKGVVRSAVPLRAIDRISDRLWFLIGVAGLIGLAIAIMMISLAVRWSTADLRRILMQAKLISRRSKDGLEKPELTGEQDEFHHLEGSLHLLGREFESLIAELANERDRFESVLKEMQDAVVALDSVGCVVLMNAEARLLLDLPSLATGRPLTDFIRVPQLIELIKKGQIEPSRAEFELSGADSRVVLANARPLKASQGVVLVLHDVSEIRRLERMRKDFVANVSHELRTPVSIIQANAETLLDGGLTDEKHARRFVEAQLRNAERLGVLINDILDLSKIEAEKYPIEIERIELKAAVQEVLYSMKNSADKKNITLRSTVNESEYVRADMKALTHVLSNLVDNAIKYSNPSGTVEINSDAEDGYCAIRIRDDGPGIEPKYRERIFERFYRVDKGRSRDAGGTGLGLAIVKHLVDAMSGTIKYEVQAARGSMFCVRLPNQEDTSGGEDKR